jgi:TPR repeat protein
MSPESVDPYDKTKIIAGVPEMPVEATLTAPLDQPGPAAARPAPKPRKKRLAIALWAAALLSLTGGMTWWFLGQEASTPRTVAASTESIPLSLQGYMDAAHRGDPKAMRMLGASYTYGLGVRADRTEGAVWYRKAAEAGDKMAAQELVAVSGRKR